jgi:hypothetical protein
MKRASLWIVTAFVEAGTGLSLLMLPAVPLWLLLGVGEALPETIFVARVAGAALVALGVACWPGRNDKHDSPRPAVILGVLIYDVAATVLLAYAGVFLGMSGLALWPAVVVHSALAVWCVVCLLAKAGSSG